MSGRFSCCDPDCLVQTPNSRIAPKSIGEGASGLFRGWPGSPEDVSCSGATPDLHRCNLGVALEYRNGSIAGYEAAEDQTPLPDRVLSLAFSKGGSRLSAEVVFLRVGLEHGHAKTRLLENSPAPYRPPIFTHLETDKK